jgi:D-3-phosphoglycerate dehydrogenase
VGVDNIDADAATRRGIVVMNTPGANAVAVAELSIGLMLALARKLPAANGSMHAGKWEKKNLQGAELRGKTLGILGLGRIGLEVAKRAKGFGLEIIGSDPFVSAAVARENGIKLVTLDELIAGSDYITLHVGLTPQTAGVINAKSLAAMKKGVRIVNCARGELIDDAALVAALKSGQVAGAALDVFVVEPAKETPYHGLDNVILTPHIGGSTEEAQRNIGKEVADKLIRYSNNGSTLAAVNFPEVSLPAHSGKHRLLHIHRNQPGVLTAINAIFSEDKINIAAEYLLTNAQIGYVVIDIDPGELGSTAQLRKRLDGVPGTIRTRLLY